MQGDDIPKNAEQSQIAFRKTKTVSRRALLAGTAGLTIGGVLGAPAAIAEHRRVAGPVRASRSFRNNERPHLFGEPLAPWDGGHR